MNLFKGYVGILGAAGLVFMGLAKLMEGDLEGGLRQIIEGVTLFGIRRAVGPIGK